MSELWKFGDPSETPISMHNGVTDDDRTILRAIGLPRRYRLAVAAELDMSSPAMHQRAAHLLDDPEVERAMPVEVHRLRRVRDKWRAARVCP